MIQYPIGNFAPGEHRKRCYRCTLIFTGSESSRQCFPCAAKHTPETQLPLPI